MLKINDRQKDHKIKRKRKEKKKKKERKTWKVEET